MTLYDFTYGPDLPQGWNAYSSLRTNSSNVVAEDGQTSLWTRQVNGVWRGASLVFEQEQLYGRFSVDCRADQGKWTKALLMLIYPAAYWPPEVDFLEMGGDANWDRHKIALTAHYDSDNKMIHRAFTVDMTRQAVVSCEWDSQQMVFEVVRPDGSEHQQQVIANPGIYAPLKLHMTYWPTHKKPTDPWPVAPSRMQVRSVTIE